MIHNIDPIAFSIFSIPIYWYGLMYLFGFISFLCLSKLRLKHSYFQFTKSNWSMDDAYSILFYSFLGLIIGGRLLYCLIYNFDYYINNPMSILDTRDGGMSFHGALIGIIISLSIYVKRHKKNIIELFDFVTPCVGIGIAFGRLGNFINGELYGKPVPTDFKYGVVFPQSGDLLYRHPSQLYQMILEGILLFFILWLFARKSNKKGQASALFLILYGIFRIFSEFFREPDPQIGVIMYNLNLGQLLCIPMIFIGIALYIRFTYYKYQDINEQNNVKV